MIERVARALAEREGSSLQWHKYTVAACTAIAAMREPTPFMVACAAVASVPVADPDDMRLAVQAAQIVVRFADVPASTPVQEVADAIATMWPAMREMIAAALTEPSGGV